MKRFGIITVMLLSVSRLAFAQSNSDQCHVYLVDVKAAEQAYKSLPANASPEAQAKSLASVMKILGVFPAKISEEELTTRSFPFPNSKLVITASVFYTDESMPGDSITLALSVSDKAERDAASAQNNAVAEVNYSANTRVVRVRKRVDVNGRNFLVGLQCDHKEQAGTK
ncbi:MAG: hypothetical protein M3362_05080 [Acidobacteriota bacterium]|nr:hypothetical protein [Acidobacteriota bacterium]